MYEGIRYGYRERDGRRDKRMSDRKGKVSKRGVMIGGGEDVDV